MLRGNDLASWYVAIFDEQAKMDTFDNRLVFQKRAYLLKKLGAPLPYDFRWYIRGPYSRELTRDAFEWKDLTEAGVPVAVRNLKGSEEVTVANAQRFFQELSVGDPQRYASRLEIAASLVFLLNESYPPLSKEDAVDKLLSEKPRLKTPELPEVQKTLEKFNLL